MRRGRLLGGLLAALAVTGLGLTLASGVRSTSGEAAASSAGPVTQVRSGLAPSLTGTTLTGEPFDLSSLRGKVVVVNVWASWCGPCRRELPALAAAQQRWSAQGLETVGIDIRDNTESANALLTELDVLELRSVTDPQGTKAVAWGARGVPETFIVDRTGQVRWWAQGAVDAVWLEERVAPLLAS